MWYRTSDTKGADSAPYNIKKRFKITDPYNGLNLEKALQEKHNPEHQSIFDDHTPIVYKGGISAIRADSAMDDPHVIPSNRPMTFNPY